MRRLGWAWWVIDIQVPVFRMGNMGVAFSTSALHGIKYTK